MQICIFEDNLYKNFEPLSYYRPVFELVFGVNTLREKILRHFSSYKNSVLCRDYLAPFMREQFPGLSVNQLEEDDYLFINGRIIAGSNIIGKFDIKGSEDIIYIHGETLAAAKLSAASVKKLKINGTLSISSFEGVKKEHVEVETADYIFDCFKYLNRELIEDYNSYKQKSGGSKIKEYTGVHFIEKNHITIEEGVVLKPGVVIDASGGPVLISKNAFVFPNSVIEGPVFIGESSIIKSCSTVYQNVSIGKVCKVGGEIEDLVMLDYSNKQHSGFIGHAYLGSWINLGADTNCSDLKNNYSTIKITNDGKEIETGLQFLGLLMGDHSKSAINTMFNTGTVAGFSCNIYGAGFPDKFIPSFSWGGSEGFIEYKIDKSIETASKVLGRRKKIMTKTEEELFRKIFELTANARTKG
jgi:UDP-N-acetylglucosamine diphosphorylase / glucose-1-phosphate thymidylyltransferase / UDP-N-acetylgalactosamine diphosphorylase / glucosamine-1-phosphate N-acetyltransferase / galactosamine-1-phosphate N-acetyltransferase